MDALYGINQVGGNTLTSPGFAPLAPSIGLASTRLTAPGALQASGSPLGSSALLQETAVLQSLSVQMMQLLLSLMQGQQGQAGGAQAAPADAGVAPVGGSSSGGSAAQGVQGASGPAPAQETKDKGEITKYIEQAAGVYGADPKVMVEVARRESNFQTGVVNDWDSNAKKGTPSKGLFQFIEPTFKSYAAEAKKAKPEAWAGLGELNWNDWRQQALAAAWAIANGKGSAWSTYKAAGGK